MAMSTSMQQTSLEAYDSIKHSLGAAQLRVRDTFYESPGVADWTNLELARSLGWDINRVTGRVYELRRLGVLEESRKRTCLIGGRNCIAWRIRRSIIVTCSLCGAEYSTRFDKCPACGKEAPQ